MTVDEFDRGLQVLFEGWNGLMQSVTEMAESIQKMWEAFFSNPKLWPKRNGIPPKKYGMSLRKHHASLNLLKEEFVSVPIRTMPIGWNPSIRVLTTKR